MPRAIQDTVLRRRVRATPAVQHVARLAAVAGRRFDFSLLQALAGEEEPALLQHLGELVALQLVVDESAERFAFRHAVTREAIYGQVLERERRGLHRAVADAIERRDADSAETHLPDLAHHHYPVGNWQKAQRYAERMGERARAMHAPRPRLSTSAMRSRPRTT